MKPTSLLEEAYQEAMETVGSNDTIKSNLDGDITKYLREILKRSESSKPL